MVEELVLVLKREVESLVRFSVGEVLEVQQSLLLKVVPQDWIAFVSCVRRASCLVLLDPVT